MNMSVEKNNTSDPSEELREQFIPGRATSLDGKKLVQDWLGDLWDPGNEPSAPEPVRDAAPQAEPEYTVRRPVEEPSYEKERLKQTMNRARERQRQIARETGTQGRESEAARRGGTADRGADGTPGADAQSRGTAGSLRTDTQGRGTAGSLRTDTQGRGTAGSLRTDTQGRGTAGSLRTDTQGRGTAGSLRTDTQGRGTAGSLRTDTQGRTAGSSGTRRASVSPEAGSRVKRMPRTNRRAAAAGRAAYPGQAQSAGRSTARRGEPIDFPREKKAQAKRKKKVSRRQQIRRARGFLLLSILAAVVFLVTLRVERITVTDSSFYSEEEVMRAVFDQGFRVNPIGVLIRERRQGHKEIPFIRDYRIRWTGIRTMDIRVEEKVLAGYMDRMGTLLYFDSVGMITESTQQLREDVPRVEGLATEDLVLGEKIPGVREEIFTELMNITRYLNTHNIEWKGGEYSLMESLDCITFDPVKNVTLVFGDLSVVLGGDRYLEEKLQEMEDILPQLQKRRGILYLDGYDPADSDQGFLFKDPEASQATEPAESDDRMEAGETASEDGSEPEEGKSESQPESVPEEVPEGEDSGDDVSSA